MTRTERSASLRAILKDRSESRTGLDKSIRKNGAGPHNWGRLADERVLEDAALRDEEYEFQDDSDDNTSTHSEPLERKQSASERRSASLTEEEVESAKLFRKNVFKGQGVDLAAIARTSAAVSTSPQNTVSVVTDADTTAI